jgi:hypothetical protein
MRKVQGLFAGTREEAAEWIRGYRSAGASQFVLRSPDLRGQIEALAGLAASLRGV